MNVMKKFLLLGIVTASLAGCGDTPGERAVSGAGIGAGAGALTGAVTGGSVGGGGISRRPGRRRRRRPD